MKRITLAAPAIVLALALAGCGDEDSDAASAPASVMPADSPIYFEVTIRPEGEEADNLEALLSELGELPLIGSVGDPGDFIIEQLESQAASSGVDFSYADDVEPWLGERAGFSVFPSETGEDIVVAAIETTDEDEARDAIEELLEQGPADYAEEEYEGVNYLTSPTDEFSFGVFDGHVVFATPGAFEDAVDASAEESLGSSEKLADAVESFDDGSLGSLYLDLAQFEQLAESPEDAEEFEQAQAIAPEFFEGAIAISAGVSAADQIYLDYSSPMIEGQPEAGASPLLETAPGDALGAVALSDIGAFGPPIVDLLERAQEEGADLEDYPSDGIEQAFEDETGVAFDDAAEAIGDASLWVRGQLPDDVEVGGEMEVTDTAVAEDLIDAVQKEIEQEGEAELGPPVGGSDVGFSALKSGPMLDASAECTSVGDAAECLPAGGAAADLPFANVELDGDVIRYGFFKDEQTAKASDPDGGGDFSETEAYAAGEEAIGDEFDYLGAVDLGPILDQAIPSSGTGDDFLEGGPEALIAPFLADKLGVVAVGQRYSDDVAVTRYVLRLAE